MNTKTYAILGLCVVAALASWFAFGGSPAASTAAPMTLDCGNGVKLELVEIPSGTFMMGSPESEEERHEREVQHEVTISKPFYMGIHEVTQAQYQAVMGTDPSSFEGDDLPVEQVTWNDAVEFCRKLSEKTGRNVRLPTEAEWEYACRAGTTTPYNTGETIDTDQANIGGPQKQPQKQRQTVSVGSFKPNAWGLYDMHGNVFEWCSDWLDYDYYNTGNSVDPQGPSSGTSRVQRGGAWSSQPSACRSAYRSHADPDSTYRQDGFRIALD